MEKLTTLLSVCLVLIANLLSSSQKTDDGQGLYNGFINPPSESRPFVRWWWNGNCLDKAEIIRELDILQKAGIGGVEINPIAMPAEAKDIGAKPIKWLNKEWNRMLVFAAREVQKRGMIADMIVGSGWPFGGEFLKEEETIQRVITNKIACKEGDTLREDKQSLYQKALSAMSRKESEEAKNFDILFIRLVPLTITSPSQIIDLTGEYKKNNRLLYHIPAGRYELVYGILQKEHRQVALGALGAAGPVMNHYDRDITLAYLGRLKKISQDTGVPLNELIRALFCDSIELAGANWTDGFEELFFDTYQYRLDPWLSFVFYDPFTGYPEENFVSGFSDQLKRVRYDFNKLLVQVFLKNFTQEFQDFCTSEGILCRYQAYGTPFLMGMMEGNMIADIPESNNWIYSSDMDADEWNWSQGHGYMIWNLYAASGGHLTGRKIISCEAMTNTRGVFKTSLDEIKQHDDMNFITGINHSVLHGYNYSPPEAGFPGWVRFGSYFSEQNTWWPYFPKWVEYNARLSYVFQNSNPVKKIAILAPEGDIWSSHGLTRSPFHTQPWYCYRLWEPISQSGSSCDYIGQNIIREGKKEDGSLTYGPMSYQTILLSSVRSLQSKTALALLDFVKNGGKLVAIGEVPARSLSYQNSDENDAIVQRVFKQLKADFPERFFEVSAPGSENDLLPWTMELFRKTGIQKDVEIDFPDKAVYQIHKKAGEKDIWFFANSSRVKTSAFKAVFPTEEKAPWIWNPEDGTRSVFPFGKNRNELNIELDPLQSLLIVFEPTFEGEPVLSGVSSSEKRLQIIQGPWDALFEHVNGQNFKRNFQELTEFGTSHDPQLNTFAGTVTYTTIFNSDGTGDWVELGEVNKGICKVSLNGKQLGVNWYGRPLFPIDKNVLRKGKNKLQIKYIPVLSNYCKSLKDNPTAEKWTLSFQNIPIGLENEVIIYEKK
ncbi:MAG: hypothetical protein JXR31_16430 [Prolixibacteraceae bacterium]|nr:hypothetical protein [Prolixibacteraceae bacterium]